MPPVANLELETPQGYCAKLFSWFRTVARAPTFRRMNLGSRPGGGLYQRQ